MIKFKYMEMIINVEIKHNIFSGVKSIRKLAFVLQYMLLLLYYYVQ